VALVAVHAVINIATDVRVLEVVGVVVAMASGALEHAVVARIRVARRAHTVRVPVIRREIGVIERRPSPTRRGVAGIAGLREAGRGMVRVRRTLIVRIVAAVARGRQRRVVVVHVALGAGHVGRVISRQGERRRGVIEGCAQPVGEIVAGVARGRETDGRVRRIIGAVVIRLVALDARRIRNRVGPTREQRRIVALRARHRRMEPGQREPRGSVIEGRTQPVGGGVALIARRRESGRHVVRIGRSVVVRLVAGIAHRRASEIIWATLERRRVALRALQGRVEPGEGETCGRVIESRTQPVGRGMARLAGGGEISLHVARIGRAGVVRPVAIYARGRRGEAVRATLE